MVFSFSEPEVDTKKMHKGTKIGWLLIALSIMLSVWVIVSEKTVADTEGESSEEVLTVEVEGTEDDPGGEASEDGAQEADLLGEEDEGEEWEDVEFDVPEEEQAAADEGTEEQAADTEKLDTAASQEEASAEEPLAEAEALGTIEEEDVLEAATAGAANDTNEDFEVSGSTLVAYNGSGGAVTLPDGITAIGGSAFSSTGVSSVANDDSVKSFASNAFYNTKLSSYSLPSTLSSLSQDAFRASSGITSFSGGSSTYSVYGGCIYKDGGKTL